MGYDIWLPSPPKVKKPRSAYNAASLAYLGDCIFEVSDEFYLKLLLLFSLFKINALDYFVPKLPLKFHKTCIACVVMRKLCFYELYKLRILFNI